LIRASALDLSSVRASALDLSSVGASATSIFRSRRWSSIVHGISIISASQKVMILTMYLSALPSPRTVLPHTLYNIDNLRVVSDISVVISNWHVDASQ
jgi:hypothetical protein